MRLEGIQPGVSAVHFAQDTQNETYKAAQGRADEPGPRLEELDVVLKGCCLRTLTGHARGEVWDQLWQADRAALSPVLSKTPLGQVGQQVH